jgi:hypothetical protein
MIPYEKEEDFYYFDPFLDNDLPTEILSIEKTIFLHQYK